MSVFLAVEQDPGFAAHAARGTLLGLLAVAAFCLVYARSARGSAWIGPTTLGLGVYALVTWLVSLLSFSLIVSALLVLLILGVALIALGAPTSVPPRDLTPRWDLPLRMATATGMVLLITGAASALGPKWSGLLSPFPVFACVMAVFAHSHGGAGSAHRLLRGVIVGSLAFASFFVVVALLVERLSLVVVYSLAAGAALAVNGLSLVTLLRRPHAG